MGNFLGISKRELRHIKKVDGTLMNLPGTANAKEVDFQAGSVYRPVDLIRHLPHSAELRTGDLYLRNPIVSALSRGLSKEEMVDKLRSSIVSSRIISTCENGSTVRLTIGLSKKEFASLDGQHVMKKFLASFSLLTMERSPSEWMPSLDPIDENPSFVLHHSTSTRT